MLKLIRKNQGMEFGLLSKIPKLDGVGIADKE